MVQTPVAHPSSTAQTDEKKSDETELAQTTPQTSEPVTQEAFVQQVPHHQLLGSHDASQAKKLEKYRVRLTEVVASYKELQVRLL